MGKAKQPRRKKKIRLEKDTRINLLMDIQARLQGRGPGMERWMKIHNLKEAAKTLNYLTEHGITDYDLLAEKAEKAAADFEAISTSIKQAEHRMEQSIPPCWIKRKQPMRITSGCARRTRNKTAEKVRAGNRGQRFMVPGFSHEIRLLRVNKKGIFSPFCFSSEA